MDMKDEFVFLNRNIGEKLSNRQKTTWRFARQESDQNNIDDVTALLNYLTFERNDRIAANLLGLLDLCLKSEEICKEMSGFLAFCISDKDVSKYGLHVLFIRYLAYISQQKEDRDVFDMVGTILRKLKQLENNGEHEKFKKLVNIVKEQCESI